MASGKYIGLFFLAFIILIIVVFTMFYSFQQRVGYSEPRTTSSPPSVNTTTYIEQLLRVSSASVVCDYVDVEKHIVMGKCSIYINVLNNSSQKVFIHGIVFQDVNKYVFLDVTLNPGESRSLTGELDLPTGCDIYYIQYGYLDTSIGRIRVNFEVST